MGEGVRPILLSGREKLTCQDVTEIADCERVVAGGPERVMWLDAAVQRIHRAYFGAADWQGVPDERDDRQHH